MINIPWVTASTIPKFFGGPLNPGLASTMLGSDVPFEDIYATSVFFKAALRIKRIQLASPGFLDFIGSINPLKTIADFISSYRAENTKRAELHTNALLKREELRSQFALRVLELMPDNVRVEHSGRFAEIAQTVIDPAFTSLERVAINPKVERVYLLEEKTGDSR